MALSFNTHPHLTIKKRCEQIFHGKYVIHDKDAISNAMASIIEGYEANKDKIKNFDAWVLGAIHHHYCNYIFLKKRQQLFLQMDELSELVPIENMISVHDLNTVKEAVLKLAKPYSEILHKRLFEEMTHKEIAKDLQMSEVTVRKYYSRSILKIKGIFRVPDSTFMVILFLFT
ncbi:MAG: sigma-70 family RNA polymerase sigma factor [Cyclobacteriaceae bacterium]